MLGNLNYDSGAINIRCRHGKPLKLLGAVALLTNLNDMRSPSGIFPFQYAYILACFPFTM